MKDDKYYLFQTPIHTVQKLLVEVADELVEGETVLEPFKGEGHFYDSLPTTLLKEWCEIEDGRDYKFHGDRVFDWVITNPPFRMADAEGKLQNCFIEILFYFSTRVTKGIMVLINQKCLNSLTPCRMSKLGLHLDRLIVCSVPQWYGRYYFLVFKKEPNPKIKFLT
jgi:hypothetical protein